MQQPAVIKSFKSDDIWDLDKLNMVMPDLVAAKKVHDEEVEKKGEPSQASDLQIDFFVCDKTFFNIGMKVSIGKVSYSGSKEF